jgi:hypothetical protein
MIFYTAVDEQGRTHWEKTQADARAINKKFEQVDVPVDKPGLHVWLNATQQKLDDLTEKVEVTTPTPALKELMQPDFVEDESKFDPDVLESQVEALGALGHQALDRFDGWSELCGISAAFARGVALLNVIASDQHSLALVFLRERLKKRKRFA